MKKYVILQAYKNGNKLYIANHQLENGTWRSNKLEDARRFETYEKAKWFLENKYIFGGNFEIKEIQ